eukprot:scaffold4732_cov140-Cylindrotheca_fusiformis.AAC.1
MEHSQQWQMCSRIEKSLQCSDSGHTKQQYSTNFYLGAKSWALKQVDRQRLESFHHRCLRAMANITMFDVKEKQIHNAKIREMMRNCYTIHQTMEIRRLRWLEKLSEMPETRNPSKIFISWIPQPRPTGRLCKTISKAYAYTL